MLYHLCRLMAAVSIAAGLGLTVTADDAFAAKNRKPIRGVVHPRKLPAHVGGYSYTVIDTYTVPPIVIAPNLVHQGGPFDSGFFFDSNVTTIGSQAPYMN